MKAFVVASSLELNVMSSLEWWSLMISFSLGELSSVFGVMEREGAVITQVAQGSQPLIEYLCGKTWGQNT